MPMGLSADQPGKDQAQFDFTDPARSKAPDLGQLSLLVELLHLTYGARRLIGGHGSPAQRDERFGRQDTPEARQGAVCFYRLSVTAAHVSVDEHSYPFPLENAAVSGSWPRKAAMALASCPRVKLMTCAPRWTSALRSTHSMLPRHRNSRTRALSPMLIRTSAWSPLTVVSGVTRALARR